MVKSVYNFIHVTLSSLKRNTGFKEFHGNLSQKKWRKIKGIPGKHWNT